MTYFTVQQADNVTVNLSLVFPTTCQLITLPNLSYEGRTSHAIRLGAGAPGPRDTVFLLGGVHAREWGSCEILLYLALDLLRAYHNNAGLTYGGQTFTAQQIRTLLETLSIVIFPLANPDGLHYSQTTVPMWRKNRNPDYCLDHDDCAGVDINRNFDFLFDYQTAFHPGSHVVVTDDPCDDETYQGPHAFSEAESRNVRWLLDANPRTRWFVDVHSYSNCMMYSWGDDKNQSTDRAKNFRNATWDGQRGLAANPTYGEYISTADLAVGQALGQAFCASLLPVRGTVYTPKPSFDMYPTAGASDDYTFSRYFTSTTARKVYSFTLEFGDDFAEDWAEMQHIIRDVCAGLIGMCLAAPGALPPDEPTDKSSGSIEPFLDPDVPASGYGSSAPLSTPIATEVTS